MKVEAKIDIQKLKDLRDRCQLSISDLAERLGYKTPSGYWLIEQGKRKVSIDALYRLSKLYQCDMEELIIKV